MRKPKQTEEIFLTDIKDPNAKNFVQPLYVALAEEVTTTRRNISSTKDRTDKYANIENGIVPYATGRGKGGGNIEIRDAVILCQKAYYNIPIFTNVINLMGEFSNGKIYWKDGSAKSREFFAALFESLNIWSIQDQFYREFYRSGNVFEYRFDGKVKEDDLKRLTQVYGTEITAAAKKGKLPIRYVLLNPADIQLTGAVTFSYSNYFKTLSDYELQRLRKPNSVEEQEFFDSLPAKTKAEIKAGGGVLLPLEPEKLKVVFYKKQDYEPFAIPMGFGVLADINWKEEMKRIDMAVSRTMQQVVLLLTMGESPSIVGGWGVNQDNLNAMRNLMANQSVSRVLVADFTVKGEWLIPDVGKFLGPEKYTIVNQDIQVGLNYVLFGEEKFANQQIKVQVFIERLKEGRNAFINSFLLPEVKRIAEEWGFKNYPTPYYEDINLKDDLQFGRLYVQMVQYGILTPEEGIEAIQTNKLPTAEESLASQEELKKLKDKGFYQPIMGGPAAQMDILKEQSKQAEKTMQRQQEHDEKTQKRQLKHDAENPVTPAPSIHINAPTKSMPAPNGRPSGTKSPQSTKNVKPIGASYSLSMIKDNMILASALQEEVEKNLKVKFKAKQLNEEQLGIAKEITHVIVANEEPKEWQSRIFDYIDNPVDKNPDRIKQIQDIAFEHSLDDYLASILLASIKE